MFGSFVSEGPGKEGRTPWLLETWCPSCKAHESWHLPGYFFHFNEETTAMRKYYVYVLPLKQRFLPSYSFVNNSVNSWGCSPQIWPIECTSSPPFPPPGGISSVQMLPQPPRHISHHWPMSCTIVYIVFFFKSTPFYSNARTCIKEHLWNIGLIWQLYFFLINLR